MRSSCTRAADSTFMSVTVFTLWSSLPLLVTSCISLINCGFNAQLPNLEGIDPSIWTWTGLNDPVAKVSSSWLAVVSSWFDQCSRGTRIAMQQGGIYKIKLYSSSTLHKHSHSVLSSYCIQMRMKWQPVLFDQNNAGLNPRIFISGDQNVLLWFAKWTYHFLVRTAVACIDFWTWTLRSLQKELLSFH